MDGTIAAMRRTDTTPPSDRGPEPAARVRRPEARPDEYHPRMSDVLVVLIVILVIVLVWRGPKTLPGIGAMLGRGVREAKRETAKLRSDGDAEPKS
jgi:hypothetical protein